MNLNDLTLETKDFVRGAVKVALEATTKNIEDECNASGLDSGHLRDLVAKEMQCKKALEDMALDAIGDEPEPERPRMNLDHGLVKRVYQVLDLALRGNGDRLALNFIYTCSKPETKVKSVSYGINCASDGKTIEFTVTRQFVACGHPGPLVSLGSQAFDIDTLKEMRRDVAVNQVAKAIIDIVTEADSGDKTLTEFLFSCVSHVRSNPDESVAPRYVAHVGVRGKRYRVVFAKDGPQYVQFHVYGNGGTHDYVDYPVPSLSSMVIVIEEAGVVEETDDITKIVNQVRDNIIFTIKNMIETR